MLINVKMPTIVGILRFMSRINFLHSWVEHETSFITSWPGFLASRHINKKGMLYFMHDNWVKQLL